MSKKYTVNTNAGIAMTTTKGHRRTARALKHAFLWACGTIVSDMNIADYGNNERY